MSRRYSNRISSNGGIDSMLHVKLYDSNEPLNVGDMNSAGPGLPDISMYFLVRPSELSATQLYDCFFVPHFVYCESVYINPIARPEQKYGIHNRSSSIGIRKMEE